MSRAKRAHSRRKRLARNTTQTRPPEAPRDGGGSRRQLASRRARIAKLGVTVAATISAAAVMGLARITYAGHQKHATPPLAIPQPLYAVVRQNLLQAGILAPATAPPSIATSSS